MNKKTLLLIGGFLTFTIGFLSIVLRLIGAQFMFLSWIDFGGRLVGFLIQLLMIVGGIVMAMWARTDFEKEDGLY